MVDHRVSDMEAINEPEGNIGLGLGLGLGLLRDT